MTTAPLSRRRYWAAMAAPTRTPKSTWIDAGLQALAAGGPDAVRIEPLAQRLGVTRGGFYWHFGGRDAFLGELLDTWERRSTDDVLERVEREGGDVIAAEHDGAGRAEVLRQAVERLLA